MFACGERVLYGVHGICVITGVEKQMVNRKRVEYYILEPMEQPGAKYLVPTQNQVAVAKLRPILTKEQIMELLHSEEARKNVWIQDENLRKQQYRDLIRSGDRTAMISMVGSLLKHKRETQQAGKKFHLCDESFLKDAQKLLSAEFSLVLGITPQEIGPFIQNEMMDS